MRVFRLISARQRCIGVQYLSSWQHGIRQSTRPVTGMFQNSGIVKRHIHVSQVLMPPLIFTGLFLALWTYKCVMLVLFQNAIIYNPFLPPNARSMRISEYAKQCGGIKWREDRIKSMDGTEIALCTTVISCDGKGGDAVGYAKTPVYILYFQGNASSLPPRLPDISSILRRVKDLSTDPVEYMVVCVSYRGFWTSHDRPSERGINLDCEAALQWVSKVHRGSVAGKASLEPIVILWGQSIGCGFATNLAAKTREPSNLIINALVLETPFTNTRAMLTALYPQKWLPYRHLWPFLRNHLDSWANLDLIVKQPHGEQVRIYIVEAGSDELVPNDHGTTLHQRCQDLGLFAERHKIRGALHNDVMIRKDGKQALAQSMASAVVRTRAAHLEWLQTSSDKPSAQARTPGTTN